VVKRLLVVLAVAAVAVVVACGTESQQAAVQEKAVEVARDPLADCVQPDEIDRNGDVDCSGQDLSNIDLSGIKLVNSDAGASREIDLSEAVLVGANLSGAYLRGTNLSGANLSGANLSAANLSRANLSGANLSGATLAAPSTGSSTNLEYADLTGANLEGVHFHRTLLSGANLSGVDLRGTTGISQYYADRARSDKYTRWPAGISAPKPTEGIVPSRNSRLVLIGGGYTEDCRVRAFAEAGVKYSCRIVDSFPDPDIAGRLAICKANYGDCGPIKVRDRYFNFTWVYNHLENYRTLYP
jgi:hypothetical protein